MISLALDIPAQLPPHSPFPGYVTLDMIACSITHPSDRTSLCPRFVPPLLHGPGHENNTNACVLCALMRISTTSSVRSACAFVRTSAKKRWRIWTARGGREPTSLHSRASSRRKPGRFACCTFPTLVRLRKSARLWRPGPPAAAAAAQQEVDMSVRSPGRPWEPRTAATTALRCLRLPEFRGLLEILGRLPRNRWFQGLEARDGGRHSQKAVLGPCRRSELVIYGEEASRVDTSLGGKLASK